VPVLPRNGRKQQDDDDAFLDSLIAPKEENAETEILA
jgi:hypothetical protein